MTTILPPLAGIQAGHAAGGGFMDSIKGALGGAPGAAGTAQTPPAGPRGDGSIGLFDGVLKKALISGALGAGIGFLPFLPGGPVLGGIVGALGGAAMGVFGNWMKMKQIKQENEAALAAMGVQADDPAVKQILQSGNVSQLIPLMQQQQGGVVQQGSGVAQQGPGVAQQVPTQNIQRMTDPATGKSELIDLSTGKVVQQEASAAPSGQAAQQAGQLPQVVDPSAAVGQSPTPQQGTVAVGSGADGSAINPNLAVSPGVAPALAGGGAAPVDRAALVATLAQLQAQIDQLKAYLDEQERSEQLDKAAAR